MQTTRLFIGLAVLLWGTSIVFAQNDCNPCDPLCTPCDPCGNGTGLFTPFTFGGWIEAGVYTNSHGNSINGPAYSASRARTDLQMSQLYLFGEKEMDTRRGFDWGGRVDLAYGAGVDIMQSFGDQSFDFGWGMNRHGYGMAAYQLYGTLGYKDLSVKIGKFCTSIGWEGVVQDDFFYSTSYCYAIEPATHSGVLATYDVSDRLSLNAGWTAGKDTSFQNRYDDTSLLAGLSYALTDKATVLYWINAGKEYNGELRDYSTDMLRNDYFIQSLCLQWALTDRFTYVCQYNLRNDNWKYATDPTTRLSAYGINNHFLYKLTDKLSAGTRVEWCRDNLEAFAGDASDYWQVTLGLRWDPTDYLSIRPEVRYDWCRGGATPFAPVAGWGTGTRSDQVSGGVGMVVSF